MNASQRSDPLRYSNGLCAEELVLLAWSCAHTRGRWIEVEQQSGILVLTDKRVRTPRYVLGSMQNSSCCGVCELSESDKELDPGGRLGPLF